jgi:hypothetical protein
MKDVAMDGSKKLFRGWAAIGAALGMLVLAAPALANAPNPENTTVDQVVVNSDGSRTVTVEGTWTWETQSKCATARNGVGHQIDWFDNQTNAVGKPNDPIGILYVGDATDNIVHSDEALGQSTANGNAFWDGVPASYVAHHATDTTPDKTDAANWFGECDQVNSSGVTAGHWGPITHTYAASFTGDIKLCPIMYDPHGGHDNSGKSSVKDITAGANSSTNSYNDDNSYETNQFTGGPGSCPEITVPTLTTSASSAEAPNAIHDTATLGNTGGQTGSITFNLYPKGAGCSGTPLFTSTVSTNGDGSYQSGDYSPTQAGTYQWQASYSSSSVKGLLTPCDVASEQSTVTPPHQPGAASIRVVKLSSVPCTALPSSAIHPRPREPKGVLPCNGASSRFTHGAITVQVPKSGNYAILISYQIQVTNTGARPLALSLKDGRCDAGTVKGPFAVQGSLNGNTLAPGGKAFYTCTHTLTQNDGRGRFSSFRNTATVTGRPPSGPPVHGTSTVITKRVHPSPVPPIRRCRSFRTGRPVRWPAGQPKPKACRPQRGRHGQGFTG